MRGTPFLKQGFHLGLNTIDSPYTLDEGETRSCLNVVSSERGAIKKRTGSTLFTETAAKKVESPNVELQSIASVNINGTPYLIASGGEKLYSINSNGEVNQIGTGFTSNAHWSIIQAPETSGVLGQGPIYLTNGVDAPHYWTGAAANTAVVEWTGVASNPKLTDGVLAQGFRTLKSETAKFVASDIGIIIKFETSVEGIVNEPEATPTKIEEALIEEVISEKEIVVGLPESEGWKENYTGVHFLIERSYYEDETTKKHVPNGKYMIFAGNRVWMTGIADDPSAVRFCDTAAIGEGGEQSDPSSWPKENLVRFDRSDGNPITGIGTVGPYLVLFKKNKTWVIHNLDTGENRKLADTVGCVSHRSIVESTLGTFFLTADQGIYLTEGSRLHEMSYNVRPTILGINPSTLQNACGAYFNNHYYLSFTENTASVNNRTLDYDVMLKSWWIHDLTGNQWVTWEPIAGQISLFTIPPIVKTGVVKCFVPNVYSDSGVTYTGNGVLGAWWISPWEPFAYYVFRHRIKAPFLKKRVRQIFFNGSGEIIPIVYKDFNFGGLESPGVVGNQSQASPIFPVNFEGSEQIWGNENEEQLWGGETYNGATMRWGGQAETNAARIYAPGVAFVWSVGWGNNTPTPFEVDAYTYMIQFRKS